MSIPETVRFQHDEGRLWRPFSLPEIEADLSQSAIAICKMQWRNAARFEAHGPEPTKTTGKYFPYASIAMRGNELEMDRVVQNPPAEKAHALRYTGL